MRILLILTALLLSLPSTLQAKSSFSCDDDKYYCRDMNSCVEARYHLEQCGLTRLDSDGDGIPCERICGDGGKKGKKRR